MVHHMLRKRSFFLRKKSEIPVEKNSGEFLELVGSSVEKVQEQYERFPYPTHGMSQLLFGKPSLFQSHVLSYEWGQFLRTGRFIPHTAATRILVAGCGTFEPLVVCRAHPHAEITALDISEKSLAQLKFRSRLQPYSRGLRFVKADLHQDLQPTLGEFDYILCTGVLHHTDKPEKMLATLRSLLKPTGVMRLMMYPQHSRYWIYELIDFFSEIGLSAHTPDLREKCLQAIQDLEPQHPLRTSFENYADSRNMAGLIDGFFHAHDKPLAWSQFRKICRENELSLLGFGHAWHSQPGSFEKALRAEVWKGKCTPQLLQDFLNLGAWERIEFLDLLHELSVNPVFWLGATHEPVGVGLATHTTWNPVLRRYLKNPLRRIARAVQTAPLMPPSDLTHLYARERVRISAPEMLTPENLDRWITGGWLLGTDGLLPQDLMRNRAEATSGISATTSVNVKPLKLTRQTHLEQALQLWVGTDAEKTNEALSVLEKLVEPRINSRGEALPQLSMREEIQKRTRN